MNMIKSKRICVQHRELVESQTHDQIWNAAQTELRTQGHVQLLAYVMGKK